MSKPSKKSNPGSKKKSNNPSSQQIAQLQLNNTNFFPASKKVSSIDSLDSKMPKGMLGKTTELEQKL